MRYDSEHKERTRQRVLTEAAALLLTEGPERVAVATLMAKAGLTHGGFYAHFKSKDDLIAQAITQMFEESYARYVDRTQGLPPAEGLAAYIDAYLSTRHRDLPATGCPLPVMSAELPRLSAAARASFEAGFARLSGSIAKLLRQLSHEDADRLAESVIAESVGAIMLARALGNTPRSSRLLKQARETLKERLALA